MAELAKEPTILPMGYQGEHFLLSISWAVENDDESKMQTRRGLVLEVRPQDLPEHSPKEPFPHLDVGAARLYFKRTLDET